MTYERNFNLLNSKFKELFFPTLMASIAGNFAILADAFFISLFMGSSYLSVVQSIEPLAAFVNVVYWLVGLGGSILCTCAKAEFDDDKANEIFTISIILVVLISVLITVSGVLFPDFYMQVLCKSPQIRPLVSQYFFLYLIGIPFTCFMICFAYFIKTDGFIQLQFRAFLMNNGVNVIFDIILMKFLNFGIQGAALATTIGAVTSAIYILTYFLDSKGTLKFIKFKSSQLISNLIDISKAGFSGASIPLYTTIKLVFLNALITSILGEMGLAAFNMCYNTLFLVTIFIFGTTQSILPIVALYFKEEDYNGVEYVVKRSLKIVTIFGIFFTVLFAVFPQAILFLFNVKNASDIPLVLNAVRIYSLSILGYALNFLYIFYTQSVQYNRLSNAITVLEGLILPILLANILVYFLGANGFWISFCVSEVVTLLFIYLYSRYANRKYNDEYEGFFLIKQNDNGKIFEYTINGNINDAVNLSAEIQEFLSENKSATLVSMAIEEMLTNIININENVDTIDIIVRDSDEYILISIKDSGIDFNPIVENDNLEFDNISVLNKITYKVDYSRILGLNSTVITIKNN